LAHQNYTGLSENEAAQRLRQEGPNALPGAQRRSLATIALDLLREPMLLLLLAAVSIYFALGDRREALVLLSFVILISGITLYQARATACGT